MRYYHVDVFASEIFNGNGLTVVFPHRELSAQQMLSIAQELKQFETAFVFPEKGGVFPTRIFTVQEELEFAGHPALGIGAILHHRLRNAQKSAALSISLGKRKIELKSEFDGSTYHVIMGQGQPEFIKSVGSDSFAAICEHLNLQKTDLASDYPIEVVSTGLPYLLVPVKSHIENARITSKDFEAFLQSFGAKFVYVFDPSDLECRTWDNTGIYEDIATGSAAGPLIAYLVKNNFRKQGQIITIKQGKFLQRPSSIKGLLSHEAQPQIYIEGEVIFFAEGEISL